MYNEDFIPFKDSEEAKKYFSDKINNNFEFLNYQKQTGFHEVDINRFEIRKCIVIECSIIAITMIGVNLEEFLKTILKTKFFMDKNKEKIASNLDDIGNQSKEVEEDFGAYQLHNAIEKSYKENLITESERDRLLILKIMLEMLLFIQTKRKSLMKIKRLKYK